MTLGFALVGPEGGCPESFAVCLTGEAAARLDHDLRSLLFFMDQAIAACGPVELPK